MPDTNRDVEKERADLLRLLHENTSESVKAAINAVVTGLTLPKAPNVTHSTKGTEDAYIE